MKKAILIMLVMLVVMALAVVPAAWAATPVMVTINGQQVQQGDFKISCDRVYVNVKDLSDLPGVAVTTDPQEIAKVAGSDIVSLVDVNDHDVQKEIAVDGVNCEASFAHWTIDSSNGSPMDIVTTGSVIPVIMNQGVAYIPLRQVANDLGATVDWDADTRTVTVTVTE